MSGFFLFPKVERTTGRMENERPSERPGASRRGGRDLGLAGRGQVALELEDDEGGGWAAVEFLLFGGEGLHA